MKHILYQAEGKERGDQIIDSLDKESYQIKNYAARQKFRSKKAQEIALNYPIITTFQHCKGIILFFLDPGRFDWANYTGINKKLGLMNAIAESNKNAIVSVLKAIPPWLFIILTFVFAFNILKIFLFSRFILKEKNFTALKITLCSEIFYISFITGSLGVSRYALPIVPALLIGVAIGASSYKHGEN